FSRRSSRANAAGDSTPASTVCRNLPYQRVIRCAGRSAGGPGNRLPAVGGWLTTPGAPLRVLLVEDDDAYAALVDDELAGGGAVRLCRVTTLLAAEQALRRESFDALLLDLTLPDSEGLDTVQRAVAAAAGVPIVVLTSRDDEAAALEAVQRGADDYLLKSQAQ